jgi:hypothetical protein
MFPRINNRKAISAVLTTIIILVASIVLGTGVVVYSTSLFQSGGQQQAVQIQGMSYWVNGTWTGVNLVACPTTCGPLGSTIGYTAFAIKNTGDKLLAVNSITIRSQAIPFANWYADLDQVRVGQNYQAQFNYTKNDVFGNLKGMIQFPGTVQVNSNPSGTVPAGCVNVGAAAPAQQTSIPPTVLEIQEIKSASVSPLCLLQQSGPVSLTPGLSAIIYVKLPNNLAGPTDAGVTSTIGILAGSAPIAQTVRIAAAQ